MTEDMPTVDGARAELTAAELVDLYWTTTGDDWAIPEDVMVKFGRAVEARLAPTVAALEAEVARLRAEVAERTRRHVADAHWYDSQIASVKADRDAERARTDAAEAVIERVQGIVTDWGAGTVHRPRSPYYDRLRTALSDAAPCARCGGLNGQHGMVHVRHDNGGGHNQPCPDAAPQAVAAPEVVETAEALDALPVGSVVVEGDHTTPDASGLGFEVIPGVFHRLPSGWYVVAGHGPRDVPLPARVLYRPDATDGREGA